MLGIGISGESPPIRTLCFPRSSAAVDEISTPQARTFLVGGPDTGHPAFVFQTDTGDVGRHDSASSRSSPPVDGQVIEIGGCRATRSEAVNLEVGEQRGSPA